MIFPLIPRPCLVFTWQRYYVRTCIVSHWPYFHFRVQRLTCHQIPYRDYIVFLQQISLEFLHPHFHDCIGSNNNTSVIHISNGLSGQPDHTLHAPDTRLTLCCQTVNYINFSAPNTITTVAPFIFRLFQTTLTFTNFVNSFHPLQLVQ